MAKPFEATPVLQGQDLANFALSFNKKDSVASKQKRQLALDMLRKATKK
ncbi:MULTISPECIES: hypothetical protein [Bacillus]|nr:MULTISPECIES: hypothetical protein [Bacillus]